MGTVSRPITVADLEFLPRLPEGQWYELHRGEVVIVTRPAAPHIKIQCTLYDLLAPLVQGRGKVWVEIPFETIPNLDVRSADFAFVAQSRWKQWQKGYLQGSPDFMIEILSPSNTIYEMEDRRELCLQSGTQEFWIINPKKLTVQVYRPGEPEERYGLGQRIPVRVLGDAEIAVDDIFADIRS
jgi:Uma2 family endonuclease